MTTIVGNNGIVKVGANAVAEVKSFTYEESAPGIPDTAKGDADVTRRTGAIVDRRGTVECMLDPTDANGQASIQPGDSVTLGLYQDTDGSGKYYRSGGAIIGRLVETSPEGNGIASATYEWEGNGSWTLTTV